MARAMIVVKNNFQRVFDQEKKTFGTLVRILLFFRKVPKSTFIILRRNVIG